MYRECGQEHHLNRRDFLLRTAAAAAGATALGLPRRPAAAQEPAAPAAAPLLPTIRLGEHDVTRLVAGYNPIGGFSHTTLDMTRHMLEYFTAERTAEFLLRCERAGINTWQFDVTDKTVEAIRLAREQGCGIQLICLHGGGLGAAELTEVMKQGPIAIVHHGGVTDGLFRAGKAQQVHDYVKKVHDQGVLAGVSSHCPDNVKRIADEGWENDLFMTCFYYLTRPREEMQQQLGKVPVGEPFFESDAEEMTAVVQQVPQPCLGFKILAAGQKCWSAASVEQCFQYAFGRIKPTDGVIVGLYPQFADEISENAGYARKYGTV